MDRDGIDPDSKSCYWCGSPYTSDSRISILSGRWYCTSDCMMAGEYNRFKVLFILGVLTTALILSAQISFPQMNVLEDSKVLTYLILSVILISLGGPLIHVGQGARERVPRRLD